MIKNMRANKKGLTPVIAVVLLLMMTVAASGAAFFWFVRIQSEMQGGTEAYQQELTEKVTAKVDIMTTKYVSGDLHIYLINHGNSAIPIDSSDNAPTTSWILYDSENNILCADHWDSTASDCTTGCNNDLEIGEIQKIILNLGDPCNDIATYGNETMFSYTIDFSGVVGTGAQFVK
jgi:flagellin-like protein